MSDIILKSEEKKCAYCNTIPESIIFLSCDHDICLKCITKLLKNKYKYDNPKKLTTTKIKCEKCKKITFMSSEVKKTIIDFNYNNKFETIKNYNSNINHKTSYLYVEEEEPEISLNFVCSTHGSEEYNYYDIKNRELYCPQCLLSNNKIFNKSDIKSLKNSYSIINLHIEEFISKVNLNKDLIKNIKNDYFLKKSDLTNKVNSIKSDIEIKCNQIISTIVDKKNNFNKAIDNIVSNSLLENKGEINKIDETLDYLKKVTAKVNNINKKKSKNRIEDLFGFYFANKDKINTELIKCKQIDNIFSKFSNNLENKKIYNNIEHSFKLFREDLNYLIYDNINKNIIDKLRYSGNKEIALALNKYKYNNYSNYDIGKKLKFNISKYNNIDYSPIRYKKKNYSSFINTTNSKRDNISEINTNIKIYEQRKKHKIRF